MFNTKSASNLSYLQNKRRAKYFHTFGLARRDSVRDDHRSGSSPRTTAFSYTLVLTYNLWRNYPLSTFFEYIFLFIQGRPVLCWWRHWPSRCSQIYSFCGHSRSIREAANKWRIDRYQSMGYSGNRCTSNLRNLDFLISSSFVLYLLLSFVGLVPDAWMRICTVRRDRVSLLKYLRVYSQDVCHSYRCIIKNSPTTKHSHE